MRDQESDLPTGTVQEFHIEPYANRDLVRKRARDINGGRHRITQVSDRYPVHLTHGEDFFGPSQRKSRRRCILRGKAAQPIPPDGRGLLDIALWTSRNAALLLDSELICVGEGRAQITLEPGYYFVEVQTKNSFPILVHIKPGERTSVVFQAYAPNITSGRKGGHYEAGKFEYLRHPPGHTMPILLILLSPIILTIAQCFPILSLLGIDWDTASDSYLAAIGLVLFLINLGIMVNVFSPLLQRRDKKIRRTFYRRTVPISAYPWGSSETSTAFLVQNHFEPRLQSTSECAVEIDFFLDRHLATVPLDTSAASFAFCAPLALSTAKPPRITINGQPQPATWGRWRYLLSPGRNDIAITIEGEPDNCPLPITVPELTSLTRYFTIDVKPGETAMALATASTYVTYLRDEEEVSFFQPRLWIDYPTKLELEKAAP